MNDFDYEPVINKEVYSDPNDEQEWNRPGILNREFEVVPQRFPLSACSRSMDSNSALKFPFPNDFAP